MLKNTVPRIAAEGGSVHKVKRSGMKKSVKKLLITIAEIANSGGALTLVSICDHVRKQCQVSAAEATVLVQHVRSACQRAVKNGFLEADGNVFSLTDAGTELLNSLQNGNSVPINLLLDKLLSEKVNEIYFVKILIEYNNSCTYFMYKLLVFFMFGNCSHFSLSFASLVIQKFD